MQYANYCYYTAEFLGELIPEDAFNRCALQASRFLDYYTMGRAKNNAELEALKMACCALAEQYFAINKAQNLTIESLNVNGSGELQSESVGSYSRTFRSGGDSASAAINAVANSQSALAQTARQYLTGTGLLYRGHCVCTHPTL